MGYSLEELSQIVGGILSKVESANIERLAPPLKADVNTLALALSEEEIENLAKSSAKAALVPLGVNLDFISTIEVERPRLAMMKLITMFYEAPHVNSGVHPTAVVHPTAKLGEKITLRIFFDDVQVQNLKVHQSKILWK